jgi:hypothetical protein
MKARLHWNKFKESKFYLFLLGISATIWFLVRVIPKPSRAQYPCMQAAAPIMSSFVIYLLGVSASIFSYHKFKAYFKSSRYILGVLFLFLTFASFMSLFMTDHKDSIARVFNPLDNTFPIASNDPIGEAKGMFPGRVVWVHDNNATNENFVPNANSDNWWYDDYNVNEIVIKQMLAEAIKQYTEKTSSTEAWDALFKSFNSTHGRGDIGYVAGEKIAIKINLTNQCCSNEERMDATPQLVKALLYELTEKAGVAQSDIVLGDPYREFRTEYQQILFPDYPNVYYVDGTGSGSVNKTIPSTDEVLVFSDKNIKSTLPQHYLDATYFINIPCLKTHNEGGITLIAKNHQGSFLYKDQDPKDQYAIDMHYSLPGNSSGTGKYRHLVDYMGHEQTGGKGLIYIIDAIWAGESWEGWIKKFKSAPFDNDYPNSIFIGQDPVALESVGFDILFEEYIEDDDKEPYPIQYKSEIADYLSQCSSSDYWPETITYDPEDDGSPLESLGVFEHWNNASDRQYSRNLGTGNGIELNYYKTSFTAISAEKATIQNIAAPNPFTNFTVFTLPSNEWENSTLKIYTLNGQMVKQLSFQGSTILTWDGTSGNGQTLNSGIYLYKVLNPNNQTILNGKIVLN